MNGKAGNKFKGWRRAMASAALAFAVFPLLAASAGAGVPKSSGTIEITDDLAAGFAGSVDLKGGNIVLSGSLGQVAVSGASGSGKEVESGYFSKYVSTPATLGTGASYSSSATVIGSAAAYPNPSATLYEIQTSSAPDFSGVLIYASSTAWPAPLTGLSGNTTYYTRLSALYMGEDPTPYPATPMSSFLTLPALPVQVGFSDVFASSLTVTWSANTNSPATRYSVHISQQINFDVGSYFTTYASSYTFYGLPPNATHFVRVKAIGSLGDETPFVLLGSTITTAATPGATAPCAVSSTTITAYWSDSGNSAGTQYIAQVSTNNFSTIMASSQTINTYALFDGMLPNTTYYVRAASLNAAGNLSVFGVLPDALTYAAPPLKNPVSFPYVDGFSVTAQWLANQNPPQTQYLAEVSTAADFSAASAIVPGWAAGVSVSANGLNPLTLYYFRAKARNAAGIEAAYEYLGSTRTLTGVDISSPVITNHQGGGDANWRSSNTAVYNVDLADAGGSSLVKLQVQASTGPAGTGTQAFPWREVLTNISANSYTAGWGLTSEQWGLLKSGTNYISVRAYDGVGNYGELDDAFYVLKDTVPPTVTDNQPLETVWHSSDTGAYLVNFNDAEGGGGLAAVEYSASYTAGAGNGSIVPWTAIITPQLTPGATYYNGPWALNFGALQSGVTNYISVRARDMAGNIASLTDAFLVLKKVSGPAVKITAPYAAFHSALAVIAGTAKPVLDYAITGTEITIQRTSSPANYWNGTDFTAATPVWFKASGQTAWTYNASAIPWANGAAYQVVARSSDTALNYSIPYATAPFTFDTSAPSAFISTPAAGPFVETPALLAGTAQDPYPNSGVSYVKLTLQRRADLKWWNFFTSVWGTVPVSTMVAGGGSWSFYPDAALRGNLLNSGTYYVYAVARDNAIPPNESPAGLYASTFTVRDTVPPGDITVSSAAEGPLPGRLLASWVAPGDDGYSSVLAQGQFAINYSTWPGAVFSTAAAQVLISTAGVATGTTQFYLISGLLPGVTYYLAVWTADEAGLWSGPSPLVYGRAGERLSDAIAGNVRTTSGQGVTGVIVEAIDRDLAVVKTVYTVDDGSGSFMLSGLDEGIYRVQATWIDNGFASSVASDQIPTGYAEVAFTLSVDYELASIGGELPAYSVSALQTGGRYVASAAAVYVELYQRNRLVAVAPLGAGGRFLIKNLLPGSYALKVPDGTGGYKLLQVKLAPGQNLIINPLGELLKEDKVYAYPNPAGRRVTFHIESGQSSVTKQITVFDITGRVIKEFNDADFSPGNKVWDKVWDIPPGVASGVYLYSTRVKFEATGEYMKTIKKFAIVR